MSNKAALFADPWSPEALAGICRRFQVTRLDLFGSAATGRDFDPATSDFDFLVRFNSMSPAEYADAYFGLRDALAAVSGRPVDLVTEAALENPFLRARVEGERRVLFTAS
jgi:hypothetical protein